MVNIVCGMGPRVGSSFIMRQCKVHGLEIAGSKYLHGRLPPAGNPGGYYDLYPLEVFNLRKGVAKVWPSQLRYLQTNVNKLVLLEREDRDAQIQSILKQSLREGISVDPEESIKKSWEHLEEFLNDNSVTIKKVTTESLNGEIQDILTFLGE